MSRSANRSRSLLGFTVYAVLSEPPTHMVLPVLQLAFSKILWRSMRPSSS